MSPRVATPTVEETLSIAMERIRHLETAEKWQFANIRQADHFAAQGIGTLGDPWSGPGDDNFTSPIQLAIEALPAAGGVVYVKAGHYEEQDPTTQTARKPVRISDKSNVIIWAEKGAILHHTWTGAGADGIAIRIMGSITTPTTTLTGNANAGIWIVDVTATAGFAVGDMVMLHSTAVDYGALMGEIHRIRHIDHSAKEIWFEEPTWDQYLVADTARVSKLNLCKNIQVHNLTIIGSAGVKPDYGIYSQYTENLVISNMEVLDCEADNYIGGGIRVCSAVRPLVENTNVIHAGNATGTGIAFAFSTQHGEIRKCSITGARHGVAMLRSSQHPGNPRENLIDGVDTAYTTFNGFDSHGRAHNTTFRDCTARHFGGWGFYIRDATAYIENPKIFGAGGSGGIWFNNLTPLPTDIAVLRGSIKCAGIGILISENATAPVHECHSVRIEGVDIVSGTHGIFWNGDGTVIADRIDIIGNIIQIPSGGSDGICVFAVGSGVINSNVIRGVGSNTGQGIDVSGSTQHLSIVGNTVRDWFGAGAIGIRLGVNTTFTLVVGNNLHDTTTAISNLGGATNKTANNMLETGLLG